ncbi:MAG: camphor resistance protein CrcB [Verrucomicrobia bacterium RIFCSPHIGHO2_12_FULL_41_10]|nr:MAG: camphor resistance protein CrcB [Verrucomicrobia bacterium RIFCSPHIGHO2_12_FULL_41_10]HLB34530.1 fluoride efflux transporter CrcB [Chthoniobacterales bacterium]
MRDFAPWSWFVIMLGGAFGTGLRLFLSTWIALQIGESFPWGTLVVNILGCFVIGLFGGLTGPDGIFLTSPLMRQAVMIGVLGGFTTFSSFTLQTLSLFSDGEWLYAAMNIALSLVLCLTCTWGGDAIARLVQYR